jgi:hypothetical protein
VWTFGLTAPVAAVRGPVGDLGSEALDVLAGLVGADGEVDLGPDTGRVRTASDAARWALDSVGLPADGGSAASAARDGFTQVATALGQWVPPGASLLDRVDDVQAPDIRGGSRRR